MNDTRVHPKKTVAMTLLAAARLLIVPWLKVMKCHKNSFGLRLKIPKESLMCSHGCAFVQAIMAPIAWIAFIIQIFM